MADALSCFTLRYQREHPARRACPLTSSSSASPARRPRARGPQELEKWAVPLDEDVQVRMAGMRAERVEEGTREPGSRHADRVDPRVAGREPRERDRRAARPEHPEHLAGPAAQERETLDVEVEAGGDGGVLVRLQGPRALLACLTR